jgi:hypothetical protein
LPDFVADFLIGHARLCLRLSLRLRGTLAYATAILLIIHIHTERLNRHVTYLYFIFIKI